jgi:hypothetical protein
LQGNAIATGAVIIAGGASGEIWWYHPTFHCSWLCFNWSTTWSWDVLVSASIDNVRFDVDARIDVGTSGAIVQVTGQFNKLRLDYPIFDQIPIENYINPYLTTKTLAAFDASQFVACMPVLNSKFRVDTVTLSPAPAQLAISVTVKQVG